MELRISIIVRFTFAGVHFWPGAPQDTPEAYLVYPHRHLFHVEAVKKVTHGDRDIEFIGLKRQMQAYCDEQLGGTTSNMSCEHIASHLLKTFDLKVCRVFEDNENGAEVEAL